MWDANAINKSPSLVLLFWADIEEEAIYKPEQENNETFVQHMFTFCS